MKIDKKAILAHAIETIDIEAQAILELKNQLHESFPQAIECISSCTGRVILCGLGKSGLVARKISATLASTGTPSFFMHPTEALHGDLGMVRKGDVLIAISYSGESDEILKVISFMHQHQIPVVAMTGNPDSTLAAHATHVLNVAVSKEACPLQLAPTSSTTATLVMGDVIAVSLIRIHDFKEDNFASFHPGGSLGKKLLTKVGDQMITEGIPSCRRNATVKEVIEIITHGKMGCVAVTSPEGIIEGIITDGDLRRALNDAMDSHFFERIAEDMMTAHPQTIDKNELIVHAERQMLEKKITSLLVEENKKLIGIINLK